MNTWESAEMSLAALRSHVSVFQICRFKPEFVGFPSASQWSKVCRVLAKKSERQRKHEPDKLIWGKTSSVCFVNLFNNIVIIQHHHQPKPPNLWQRKLQCSCVWLISSFIFLLHTHTAAAAEAKFHSENSQSILYWLIQASNFHTQQVLYFLL